MKMLTVRIPDHLKFHLDCQAILDDSSIQELIIHALVAFLRPIESLQKEYTQLCEADRDNL
jgi:hypothetical protein